MAATAEPGITPLPPATVDSLPELDNAAYAARVLRLPPGKTEAQCDDELDARAAQHGIAVPPPPMPGRRHMSSAESASTAVTSHTRAFSAASTTSADTAVTDMSSLLAPPRPPAGEPAESAPRRSKPNVLRFSHYERFLAQLGPSLDRPENGSSITSSRASSRSLPSAGSETLDRRKSGRSLARLTSGLRTRLSWQRSTPPELLHRTLSSAASDGSRGEPGTSRSTGRPPTPRSSSRRPCVRCRETCSDPDTLQTLPCGHACCRACLQVMARQAAADEAKMPPRCCCCARPVPGSVLRGCLPEASQQALLRAVVLFGTPRPSREAREAAEAEDRSRAHESFRSLQRQQAEERDRFRAYEAQCRQGCAERHARRGTALRQHQRDQDQRMRARHAEAANHLEDRQIAAEMELRGTLEAGERSVRIRLKHMEAYCDPAARTERTPRMPARVVTERDRQALRQQHALWDGMARLHQSRINVLRDRQARRMEELLGRQAAELAALQDGQRGEAEDLAARSAHEHELVGDVLRARGARLRRRWDLAMELLRRELEAGEGVRYASLPGPAWPADDEHADGDAAACPVQDAQGAGKQAEATRTAAS